MEAFIKIAELRSFTRAAEELHLTQPTISKQIVDLERFFDVRLIDRTKRTVALTKAGDIFLKFAVRFVNLKKQTIEEMAAFKGLKRGTVTVGASTIPGIYILPRLLSAYKEKYDGIQIKLIISDTKSIVEQMQEGSIDLGFVGAKKADSRLDYRKLVDDSIIIIGPPQFPDSMKLTSLRSYSLIAREIGSGTRDHFETALRKTKQLLPSDLSVIAELTDTEAIKESVKSGMGFSYISRMAVVDDLKTEKIKRISVSGLPEIKRSFYIITKKSKTVLPQVKALLDIIEKWRKNEKT